MGFLRASSLGDCVNRNDDNQLRYAHEHRDVVRSRVCRGLLMVTQKTRTHTSKCLKSLCHNGHVLYSPYDERTSPPLGSCCERVSLRSVESIHTRYRPATTTRNAATFVHSQSVSQLFHGPAPRSPLQTVSQSVSYFTVPPQTRTCSRKCELAVYRT